MSIINHMYTKIIIKSLKNAFKKEILLPEVNNYLDFIQYLDGFLLAIVKKSIIDSFESIDQAYKHSPHRKNLYYTKGLYPRRIMTLFGELTFYREYYVPKDRNTDGFFYVDHLFSLPKRDYYDPMIKALIVERSAEYSYIQSGKSVGDMIGPRFKSLSESTLSKISRQTVYNVIKQADMDVVIEESKEDVETLYIQLDEKWVHTQNTNHQMKEIKAAVIYTDIEKEYPRRKRLVNRHVITSDQSATNLRQKILDYVIQTYNVDSLKDIVLSGDGASWIKNSVTHLTIQKGIRTQFVLDRFHMHQAINHISKDDEIKKYLRDYLSCFRPNNFIDLCNVLIKENPHREDIITKNRDYIVSNWRFIKHQKDPLFQGCSMEGHISHILAALFTARPKAHSLHMITRRLRIRELFTNSVDLKQVYLSNHLAPTPEIDYVEMNYSYPTNIFDVIGHKVTEKYKAYKNIAHPTLF
ncbi:MAG: UPF0236 family transposase-like protein [Candidatus Izemoplasmataceae bacterium]